MQLPTAYRKRIAAAKRQRSWLKIDMSAFAAVMFAILFMLMAPYSLVDTHTGHGANQPRAANAEPLPGAAREDAIEVTVTRDGRIFLRDSEVSLGDVSLAIREAVGNGAAHHVYLLADERAKYADVKAVVDKIGEAGIKDVSLLSWQGAPR